MVYNGFDFAPYLRVNPHRPIAPPVTVETDDVPGRDGTRFRSARLGELTIEVDAELRAAPGDDIAELRHMLAAALVSPSPAPLILPDDPGRYHLAVLDGESELSTLWRTGEATLTFRCPDPVAYGQDRIEALGAATSLSVGGTYEALPVFEVKPTGKRFRVESATASAFVEVEASTSFDGSKTLTIDCAAQHCELGGTSVDDRVTLASTYFALAPGRNDLVATGGTGTVRWTERWL